MKTHAGQWEQIREEALRLGFDGCGVTSALPGPAVARWREWLRMGFHGSMGYMARDGKRANLCAVLPEVRSVICLRMNYLPSRADLSFLGERGRGYISVYARRVDYHAVLSARLDLLEEKLREVFPGCHTRSYVDTGPVLEKPLAQAAGLGWIGKHTNLVTRGAGSWYFLAEILTSAALPGSTAEPDHCGTCSACIDVCPTRALVAPYVLDARRCISYLTIELKGVIPLEFRKAIGNRIYGCDDCQLVCPWNARAHLCGEEAFKADGAAPDLLGLMAMDDAAFRERFRLSPVKRIKRRGLLRNVVVALGNSGDCNAAPVLTRALADPEPLIRAHAVWALGELLGDAAPEALARHLGDETDLMVKTEIARVNARFHGLPDSCACGI